MGPGRKVEKPDACEFGNCTNHRRCEDGCPKEIAIINITRLNREYVEASFASGKSSGKFSSNLKGSGK